MNTTKATVILIIVAMICLTGMCVVVRLTPNYSVEPVAKDVPATSTVQVVPTLTPEPVNTPTVIPTTAPDLDAYLLQQMAAMDCYQTPLNNIVVLCDEAAIDPLLFYDDSWQIDMTVTANDILYCGVLLRDATPPPAFTDVFDLLALASFEFDAAANYIIDGMATSNLSTFMLATPHIIQGGNYISEATRLLDSVKL